MVTAQERKYADLLERQTAAMVSIASYSGAIQTALKDLNEKFILHQEQSDNCLQSILKEVNATRADLKAVVFPILKWFAIALIVLAGGAEAIRFLG